MSQMNKYMIEREQQRAEEAMDRPSWRPPEYVIRSRWVDQIEVRASDGSEDDALPTLRGHAAVFNKLSVPLWGFREKVAPGAFTKTLADGDDIRALLDHKGGLNMLGRNTTAPPTLRLKEDKRGLAVEIDPPDTVVGRDTVALVRRGDLSQMSFGFQVVDDHWETKGGEEIRTLEKVKLFDVSVVTYPAYEDAEVDIRALRAWRATMDNGSHRRLVHYKLIANLRARESGLALPFPAAIDAQAGLVGDAD